MCRDVTVYTEGKTSFYSFKPLDSNKGFTPTNLKVFYNPKMEFNRDISIIITNFLSKKLKKKISICEPLSGCGVRGIRFAREIGDRFDSILLNDNNYHAYRLIKKNIRANKVRHIVEARNEDANDLLNLYKYSKWNFDYIDVDPFGSPIPFISSAIQALKKRDTIIAVTATDMSVLCGVYPLKALKTYGGFSLRTEYCHEIGLRLLLHKLNHEFSLNEIAMKPLLAYYADHYLRAYILLKSRSSLTNNLEKYVFIEHCFNCYYRRSVKDFSDFNIQCPICGEKLSYAGPMWSGELIDKEALQEIVNDTELSYLHTYKRIKKLLNILLLEYDMPLTYYNIHVLCDSFQINVPKMEDIISQLSKEYRVTKTHFNSRSIKTDAPLPVIKDTLTALSKK
ncbi:MAG: tRNA (guanine(10)-N(2))-dimethyltransferase [Candidatus Odinarchaeia archaeon]